MSYAPVLIPISLLWLAQPAWSDSVVPPFESQVVISQLPPDEARLWQLSDEADMAIRKSGRLYGQLELDRYLQGVLDNLFPEFRGNLRIHAVDAPNLNAFALPAGSLYIHTGLLARLENEAQLAAVLSHEAGHFVARHGYRQSAAAKSATGLMTVIQMLGIPLVGELVALSSITGYSRDSEREADLIGFDRLVKAGYDPHEAYHVFEHLMAEIAAADIKEPFFFSSHPKVAERLENYQRLATSHPAGGNTGTAEYLSATRAVREYALQADLSSGRYKNVIMVLSDPSRRAAFPGHVDYYLAEAYRRRGGEGDAAAAESAYQAAILTAPGFAPSHRSLGMLYFKDRRYSLARTSLARYLELAPTAPDRAYIALYLEQINKETKDTP